MATLERERALTAELVARRTAPAGEASSSSSSWLPWASATPSAASDAALAAVRLHLTTVITDRDLLAADLYRSMLERDTVQSERDAALQALADTSAQLARIAAGPAGVGLSPLRGSVSASQLAALLSPAAALAEAAGCEHAR